VYAALPALKLDAGEAKAGNNEPSQWRHGHAQTMKLCNASSGMANNAAAATR
jgi:hypothetical protein